MQAMNGSSQHGQLWQHGETDASHTLSLADDDFAALFQAGDFSIDFAQYELDNLQNASSNASTSAGTPGDGSGFDLGGKGMDMSSVHHQLSTSQPHTTTASEASAMVINFDNHGLFGSSGDHGGIHFPQQQQQHQQQQNLHLHHQQHQQQQQQQQQQSHHQHRRQQAQRIYGGMIPPTPSSIEIQANTQNLSQFLDQDLLDHLSQIKDDQMIFTPLVSPAVGPLEANYNHLADFNMPSSFMSPLTSPALEDHANITRLPRSREPSFSESTSPVDSRESTASTSAPASGSGSLRSKPISSRSSAPKRVGQSPSMKPQRKRIPHALLNNPDLADAAIAEARNNTPRSATFGLLPESSRASSSADSISPEPLSELMPPPPPKNKASLRPETGDLSKLKATPLNDIKKAQAGPVTPASLMKIANLPKQDTTGDVSMGEAMLTVEDSDEVITNDDKDKTREEEQQTPKLSSMKRKSSASTPPAIRPKTLAPASDSKTSTASGSIRKDPRALHSRRGSTVASPALQPKLSPAMKPLLPGGQQSTSAMMLATRSNYENIVSGNHTQLGLSYPEHLSVNLTSKKTSHKIAEKGRRNRINNALAEIAKLLPTNASTTSAGASGGGEGSPAADQSPEAEKPAGGARSSKSPPGTPQMTASKAATVETAIEYIKSLKSQLEATQTRLAAAEAELKELKAAKA